MSKSKAQCAEGFFTLIPVEIFSRSSLNKSMSDFEADVKKGFGTGSMPIAAAISAGERKHGCFGLYIRYLGYEQKVACHLNSFQAHRQDEKTYSDRWAQPGTVHFSIGYSHSFFVNQTLSLSLLDRIIGSVKHARRATCRFTATAASAGH